MILQNRKILNILIKRQAMQAEAGTAALVDPAYQQVQDPPPLALV